MSNNILRKIYYYFKFYNIENILLKKIEIEQNVSNIEKLTELYKKTHQIENNDKSNNVKNIVLILVILLFIILILYYIYFDTTTAFEFALQLVEDGHDKDGHFARELIRNWDNDRRTLVGFLIGMVTGGSGVVAYNKYKQTKIDNKEEPDTANQ